MPPSATPLQVFAACFIIASFGGVAALLRSGRTLEWRAVVSSLVYSGVVGLVIGLVCYKYFENDNIYLLIGCSGLAGLGGTTVLDFMVQVLAKGGVSINIRPKDTTDKKE